jgi:hypothetical protein
LLLIARRHASIVVLLTSCTNAASKDVEEEYQHAVEVTA